MTDSPSLADPVGKLAEEFMVRYRRGERPALTEYTERYPELAQRIRDVFPMLVVMEEADSGASSSGDATGTNPVAATDRDGGRREQIGGYRIIREVGRGGMGVVYEAEQLSLGRHVALKVLPDPIAHDSQGLERFRREARAAARLHHTNIVPVHEVGQDGGVVFYAMQFIQGQPLDAVLGELKALRSRPIATRGADAAETVGNAADVAQSLLTGRFEVGPAVGAEGAMKTPATVPLTSTSGSSSAVLPGQSEHSAVESGRRHYDRSVAQVGIQVAEALAYAHREGVIHRDIKPSNLLLDPESRVWITDFGLAKTEGDALTHTGDIIGTLRYMAPERFRGWSDPRSDVYSLGLTLYEMLLLRPAFESVNRLKLIHKVTHDDPVPPRKVDPKIPRDLETIVLKAIDKEPSRRYPSAAELAADLHRFLDDRPIRARRSGLPERAWRWGRRNPVVAGLVAAVVLLFFAGFSGVAWKWREADRERVAALEARDRAQTAAAKAEAINRFLIDDLLSMAAPEMTRGRQVTIQDVLTQAAKKIDGAFEDQPEVKASVLHTIGDVYRRMGLYPEAELLLRRALEIARHTLGPEHVETLRVMISLAWAADGAGKVAEAESLFSQALEPRRLEVLGPAHPETLAAMAQLAWAYINVEKVLEGEELFRRTLDASRRALGSRHPTTLFALNSLGYILILHGNTVEAEPLVLEAVDTSRRELGPDHPEMHSATFNFGELLLAQGKAAEAEPHLRASLDVCQRVLGPEHRFCLCSICSLSDSLIRQGKWPEAESLLREQMAIRRPLRGERIDDRLKLISKLVSVLRDQSKLAEAESLYREALQLTEDLPSPYVPISSVLRLIPQRKARGSGGPIGREVMRSELLEGLGLCLLARGVSKEAEESIRKSLDSRRSFLPETHAEIGESLFLLGAALTENGRAKEAESLLQEALGILRKALPAGHWRFAASDSFLGACLAAQGRPSEAEPLVLSGYRTLEADRHVPPLMVSLALDRVIRLYDGWGKSEKAAEWRTKRTSDGHRRP